MASVSLRPAADRDWPAIHGWLRQNEVQRWWGSLAAAEAEVIAALHSDMGLCSIVEVDGVPVGYAQAQDTFAPGHDFPAATIAGTFRVDAFIGEAEYRRRGIGLAAIKLVTDEVFATTLALAVVAIVAVKHEAAVRTYEKAGFSWVRVVEDPLLGPSWLMRLERPNGP